MAPKFVYFSDESMALWHLHLVKQNYLLNLDNIMWFFLNSSFCDTCWAKATVYFWCYQIGEKQLNLFHRLTRVIMGHSNVYCQLCFLVNSWEMIAYKLTVYFRSSDYCTSQQTQMFLVLQYIRFVLCCVEFWLVTYCVSSFNWHLNFRSGKQIIMFHCLWAV